jgi:predicted hotdog family 3-hydroxylacyl-ACP dehydratase
MLIDREALCSLIPHGGAMCLLDGVEQWDEERIVCVSHSHRREDNPLRRDGVLSVIHGVEYAAQAMAVHGGLRAQRAGESHLSGLLAALRSVQFDVDRLDEQAAPLRVEAVELMRSGGSFIYEFTVTAAGARLLGGRLTVMAQREER